MHKINKEQETRDQKPVTSNKHDNITKVRFPDFMGNKIDINNNEYPTLNNEFKNILKK